MNCGIAPTYDRRLMRILLSLVYQSRQSRPPVSLHRIAGISIIPLPIISEYNLPGMASIAVAYVAGAC